MPVTIAIHEVKAKSFNEIGLKEADAYKITFKTPTLLQAPKIIKTDQTVRHVLFPSPKLITWSLAMHWNKYAPEHLKIPDIAKLATYSDYCLVEVDYRLKPTTAIYDERKRPRGFIGWTLYKWKPKGKKQYEQTLLKLLDYANYIGIGRSRSIGFGVVSIRETQ